jgi:hypothetical protein
MDYPEDHGHRVAKRRHDLDLQSAPMLQDTAVRKAAATLAGLAAGAVRTLIIAHPDGRISDRFAGWADWHEPGAVATSSASRQVEARLPSRFSG